MKRFLILLLIVPIIGAGAVAQDAVQAKLRALFSQFDGDHNGVLTVEEQGRAVQFVKKNNGDDWARRVEQMFAGAAGPDKSVSAANWGKAVDGSARGTLTETAIKTVMIPMRDGKRMAADLLMPNGNGPFPVVLNRTPYGRKKMEKEGVNYPRGGIVFVIEDMRGRFESEGDNLPFLGCGWGENQDGVDTIEWIKKQPWCDGHIGTTGGSAAGITQNLLAGAVPTGIQAQYISVAAASLYSDASYIGGAFRKADVENWLGKNQFDTDGVEAMRAHPSYDNYWRKFDTSLKYSEMNLPAVHIGGWFDMFSQGTIDEFVGRQHQGKPGARGAQKLIMGPWMHSVGQMPAGEQTFPRSGVPPQYSAGRWFGHYLRGENNGVEKEKPVAYFVMGDTSNPAAPGNEWRYADDWPIAASETPVYFARDGRLSMETPQDKGDVRREYVFDPADPCPTVGGNNLTIPRGCMNQNRIEQRSDVLLFTTAPLDVPIEVTGRVRAKVFVSSSAVDTDVSVRLCDVYPDGKSYLIAEGIRRLRYRNSFEKPELLTPGKVEEVNVDCWSTSIIFNKGHRIRATVTSSNFPRFDVNQGTGMPFSEKGPMIKQTNQIFCAESRSSCLLLPVVAHQ